MGAACAVAIVVLTLAGATVENTTLAGWCFAAVFFTALIGIAAGVVVYVRTRKPGRSTSLGFGIAIANRLLGLASGVVFVLLAFSNSE